MAPQSDSPFLALQKPIKEVRDTLKEQFERSEVESVRRKLRSEFHKLLKANQILDLPVLENFQPRKSGVGSAGAGKKKLAGNTR